MAEIKMTRVDFRLVHGQIVVKWCKACDVDKIVVIDDVVASDDFMSQIYASAAPAGVVVKSYSQEKAKRLWEKNRFGEKSKVLILFKDIDTCYAMIKGGMELKSVQLGGVPQMGDRRAVKRAVFLGKRKCSSSRSCMTWASRSRRSSSPRTANTTTTRSSRSTTAQSKHKQSETRIKRKEISAKWNTTC